MRSAEEIKQAVSGAPKELLAMLHAKKGDLFQFANVESTPEQRMQKVSSREQNGRKDNEREAGRNYLLSQRIKTTASNAVDWAPARKAV